MLVTSYTEQRSRIAVLGTMVELHQKTPAYDLRVLRRLVKEVRPDLLLAEIHPDDWHTGELSRLSLEYREALVPLSRRTDIIVVPVGGSRGWELGAPQGKFLLGLRASGVSLLNGQLRWMQRRASGPGMVNSGWFGWVCDQICTVIAWMCGPQARREWDQANQAIVDNIRMAVRRDPGRRVLVTVDCRRRHRLERVLRRLSDVELVDYRHL